MKNEMNLASQVIELLKGKVPSICGYVSVKDYTNAYGEVSSRKINVGTFANAKERSVEILKAFDVTNIDSDKMNEAIERAFLGRQRKELPLDSVTLERIKSQLIEKIVNPYAKSSKGQKDAYTYFSNGIKVHNEKGSVYVWGKEVKDSKVVSVKGDYPMNKNGKLTNSGIDVILRDVVTYYLDLPHSKFRSFSFDGKQVLDTKGNVLQFV